jgi:hypothetical protein
MKLHTAPGYFHIGEVCCYEGSVPSDATTNGASGGGIQMDGGGLAGTRICSSALRLHAAPACCACCAQ